MPELPEVETIRRGLERRIVGARITAVKVGKPKMVRGSVARFKKSIIGRSISRIERRGKLLAFAFSGGDTYMLLHLKMTGQLMYQNGGVLVVGGHGSSVVSDLPNKYSHVTFSFADGSRLFFNDQRQFGYLQMVDRAAKESIWGAFGIEPLSETFTRPAFLKLLKARRMSVKAFLLNQQILAGIGNIYADEICFQANVLPDRLTSSLTDLERAALFASCQAILKKAVQHRGTTFSHYRDSEGAMGGFRRYLKVYGRDGETCVRCKKGLILKKTVAGRGTHFCAVCQQ